MCIRDSGRIGVIVEAETAVVNDAVKEALTNLAMQIAALNPKYVSRDETVSYTHLLSDVGNIGARNAEAAKKILKEKGIRLVAEDTGLNYGRTVELHLSLIHIWG